MRVKTPWLTGLTLLFLTSGARGLTAPQLDVAARVEQCLLAPCCYSQAVGEHTSAEAVQMRQEIEEMAASGESEAAIIARFKAQYGERILVVPDGGMGRVLFILPVAVVIFLLAILVSVLRRMVNAGSHPPTWANQVGLERLRREFSEVIERELRDRA